VHTNESNVRRFSSVVLLWTSPTDGFGLGILILTVGFLVPRSPCGDNIVVPEKRGWRSEYRQRRDRERKESIDHDFRMRQQTGHFFIIITSVNYRGRNITYGNLDSLKYCVALRAREGRRFAATLRLPTTSTLAYSNFKYKYS
jgi:hypothetical protein